MKIVAVDAGLRTGYAIIQPGRAPVSGSVQIAENGKNMGSAFASYERWLEPFLLKHRPNMVALADPFISRKAAPSAVIFFLGFIAHTHSMAFKCGVPIEPIAEGTARRAFMSYVPPKSADIKKAVVSACRVRGWPVCDDHAGDAVCIGAYAMEKFAPKRAHTMTPLFARRGRGASP